MYDMRSIGRRMRFCRRALSRMTIEEAARRSGIAKSTLGSYETGDRVPKATACVALADLYGVSVDFLLGRVDSCKVRGFGNVSIRSDAEL